MKKVLIVDDDAFLTKLYKNLLEKDGIGAETVGSGEEALSWLSASVPDLVVLDIHMPGMKGTEVLRAIRNDERLRHLYVIVFATGYIKTLEAEVGDLPVQKVISKMKCRPRALVAEIEESLSSISQTPVVPPAQSALDTALALMKERPEKDDFSVWIERLQSDSRSEARRICLLHIYALFKEQISAAMRSDETTPEGKLGRALKKLLDDLYGQPDLIQDSTAESLEEALHKLENLNATARKARLESEEKLKDVLKDL